MSRCGQSIQALQRKYIGTMVANVQTRVSSAFNRYGGSTYYTKGDRYRRNGRSCATPSRIGNSYVG